MKKTRLLATTFLVMMFTMLNAACAFANTTINGHLDSIEGNAIAGWLWDSSNPEVSQTITITVTDNATGNIVAEETKEANEYRSDLESAVIGTGNYGFHVGIEWDTLPESSYTVSLSCGETTLNQTLSHVTGTTLIHDNLIPLRTFKTTAYCPCYVREGTGGRGKRR